MNLDDSRINKTAAMRVLQGPFGQALLETFLDAERRMKKSNGTSYFGQVGFNEPGDPIEGTDLLPTIHISLQPIQPVLSEPIKVISEEGD